MIVKSSALKSKTLAVDAIGEIFASTSADTEAKAWLAYCAIAQAQFSLKPDDRKAVLGALYNFLGEAEAVVAHTKETDPEPPEDEEVSSALPEGFEIDENSSIIQFNTSEATVINLASVIAVQTSALESRAPAAAVVIVQSNRTITQVFENLDEAKAVATEIIKWWKENK